MPGILHAFNYCSSIFWKEVSDVIASSTEVSDDTVVGGGRYFSILVVERHLTEPISCFFCRKGEMFENNLPWNVEVADDIDQGRLCKQKRIWNKTKISDCLSATVLIIETYQFLLTRKNSLTILITNGGVGDFCFKWLFFDSPIAGERTFLQVHDSFLFFFFFFLFFSWIISGPFSWHEIVFGWDFSTEIY